MNTQKQIPEKRQVLVTKRRRGSDHTQPTVNPAIVRMAESQAQHRAVHRHAMVAEAAYFRAEKRGFESGHELEDWLDAELEVEAAERLSVLCPCDAITPAERTNWAELRS